MKKYTLINFTHKDQLLGNGESEKTFGVMHVVMAELCYDNDISNLIFGFLVSEHVTYIDTGVFQVKS